LGEVDGGATNLVIPSTTEVFIGNKGGVASGGVTLRRAAGGDGDNFLGNRTFRAHKANNANHCQSKQSAKGSLCPEDRVID
jgi:hypothetical protein